MSNERRYITDQEESEYYSLMIDVSLALPEQLNNLIRWNKQNSNKDPEQARRNIETIINGLRFYNGR